MGAALHVARQGQGNGPWERRHACPLPMPVRRPLAARRKIAQGLNPIDERKRTGGVPTFGEMADEVREALSAGFRNEKHKAQWKSTLETYAAPLRAKPVDTVATDDVLAVLKPIWTTKAETASRVRGRIEKVLDAAKAKGFREGENPARWRGHLDHLLPRPSKLARGHHAAMPYDEVAGVCRGPSRARSARRAGAGTVHPHRRPLRRNPRHALGRNRPRQEDLDGARPSHEGRPRASGAPVSARHRHPRQTRRSSVRATSYFPASAATNRCRTWRWK